MKVGTLPFSQFKSNQETPTVQNISLNFKL